MHIPCCIIADLDIILDYAKVKSLIKELSDDHELCLDILNKCNAFKEEYFKITKTVSVDKLRKQVEGFLESDLNWEEDGDTKARRELMRIANTLHRSRKLKEGGVKKFSTSENRQLQLEKLIDNLSKIGLFCVPVGELEYWMQDLMKGVGKKDGKKAKWAHVAAQRIKESEAKENDIWKFIESIACYLRRLRRQNLGCPAGLPRAAGKF